MRMQVHPDAPLRPEGNQVVSDQLVVINRDTASEALKVVLNATERARFTSSGIDVKSGTLVDVDSIQFGTAGQAHVLSPDGFDVAEFRCDAAVEEEEGGRIVLWGDEPGNPCAIGSTSDDLEFRPAETNAMTLSASGLDVIDAVRCKVVVVDGDEAPPTGTLCLCNVTAVQGGVGTPAVVGIKPTGYTFTNFRWIKVRIDGLGEGMIPWWSKS